MSLIIEAPNEIYSVNNSRSIKLFLAGGITNCPNWQNYVISELRDINDNLTIYNPRRKNFPIDNPKAAEEQIAWEYEHLRNADILFFWFSRGTLNPIALYELGMWCNSSDTLAIIGVDPLYERKQDIIYQTNLARPHLKIFEQLDEMVDEVKNIFDILNETYIDPDSDDYDYD